MAGGRHFVPPHPNGTDCLLHFVLVQDIVVAQALATHLYVGMRSGHYRFDHHPSPHLGPTGGVVGTVVVHTAQLGELKQVAGPCLGTLDYFGTPRQEEVEVVFACT